MCSIQKRTKNNTKSKTGASVLITLLFLLLLPAQSSGSAPKRTPLLSTLKNKLKAKLLPEMGNVGRMINYDRKGNVANAITSLQILDQELKWHRLDDGVMGGKSETLHESGNGGKVLRFCGTINTDGGGFTSVRAPIPSPHLTDRTAALRVRYRGDGKTYKVLLSDGGGMRSPSWQVDLPTMAATEDGDADAACEVDLPLEDFRPAFGPRSVSEKDRKKYKLVASEMRQLGFMLSLKLSDGSDNPVETFGEGIFDFSLEIESIEAVEEAASGTALAIAEEDCDTKEVGSEKE